MGPKKIGIEKHWVQKMGTKTYLVRTNLGANKCWYEKKLGTNTKLGKKNFFFEKKWEYMYIVPVDLSINLKEDGNQAPFTFINGPRVGNVDMDGRDIENNRLLPDRFLIYQTRLRIK